MKLLYFAWVRERVGLSGEEITCPADLATVHDLIGWLCARGENYQSAFADLSVIRAAVNQAHVPLDSSLKDAREVAFFPPVTGG